MILTQVLALAGALDPSEFGPDGDGMFDPAAHGAGELLGYLAWAVTACSVAGLVIVGTQMALQMRRGEMGEGSQFFRAGAVVVGSCVLGVTAGPLVAFVVDPYLVGR